VGHDDAAAESAQREEHALMKDPSRKNVPKPVLVDLLVHASSAARIVGHLDDRDDSSNLEQLSDHVDVLVHVLGDLLGEHRSTIELTPNGDETDMLDELRRLMARADALASTTNEQFSRVVVLTDGDDPRDFKRLAHLIEMTALAVMAAAELPAPNSSLPSSAIYRRSIHERAAG
jgi:hypothetical protein